MSIILLMARNGIKYKSDWPDLHVRIEPAAMETLKKLAKKEQRSIANYASYLLRMAVLSMAIKDESHGH